MPFNIFKKNPFPKDISMDISSHCNIDCTICSLKKEYNPKGYMSYKTLNNLKEVFAQAENIELCCNAEPTLHPQLIPFLKEIKKKSTANVNFPTNGLLLNEKMIYDLIENGLDGLRISLDGVTKKTYESIRKGSNFKSVLENIKKVNSIKKKLGKSNPHLTLVFVAMKKNVHELPRLIDLAKKLDINDVTVHGFECYLPYLRDEPLYYNPQKSKKYFIKAKEKAEKKGIILKLPLLELKQSLPCNRNLSCFITWDGYLCPCTPLSYSRPVYLKNRKSYLRRKPFGNVNKTSFKKIWNSKKYRNFRKNLNRNNYVECEDCLIGRRGVIVTQEQH